MVVSWVAYQCEHPCEPDASSSLHLGQDDVPRGLERETYAIFRAKVAVSVCHKTRGWNFPFRLAIRYIIREGVPAIQARIIVRKRLPSG